jgi:hypothetical protein
MDTAEQEAPRAKELTRLNASAKGFRSQFVSTRNVLVQALPLYADGAMASRQRTIDNAISKIGLQADKVHDAYQRLIKFDKDENRHANFEQRQNRTNTEHNNIRAHVGEVLGEVDGATAATTARTTPGATSLWQRWRQCRQQTAAPLAQRK